MSQKVPDKVILVESSPGEKMELLSIPPTLTKIDRFGGKEILVCGDILLGSRTPLYVSDVYTVNSERFRDPILEAYVKFYWVLRTRTTFLWTIMCCHTELTVLINFNEGADICCMD
ncbi:hypothetical protein TNCV_1573141 [Trichonephila clavipes]|uniref:Uncharacterized protein n=1 Tax=Trichonephila clavipes TaxID=2585209 RepID=A0A8X6VNX3_TRICX|nr:hypothetical protein TNCV_1573141 [Trichonephila clavipes]